MRNHCDVRMESLEGRMLLAGNVTASVGGDGVLRMTGDESGNRLTIESAGLPAGTLRITGDNTSINGEFGPVELSGITFGIFAQMKQGKDWVSVRGVKELDFLQIVSGSASDNILVDSSRFRNNATIQSGDGDDQINLVNSSWGSGSLVEGGDGTDLITIDGGTFTATLVIGTGRGRDTVFHHAKFPRGVQIDQVGEGDLIQTRAINRNFDFNDGRQGWRGEFADVFANPDVSQELDWALRRLPGAVGPGRGMFITSDNSTDDVFMYLTRQIGGEEGLRPRTTYQVRYDIRFASNAPINCGGIGGQPGESVYLKAGATPTRPRARVDKEGIMRLNVDHGQQAQSGKAASVVGHIGNGQDCPENPTYVSLRRRHIHTALVKTDSQGRMHLIVGTDSGYEGTTSLYYQRIGVRLIEVALRTK